MTAVPRGVFTISFDCEGLWGPSTLNDDFRRRFTTEALVETYARLCDILARYEINATFAFVGAFVLSPDEARRHRDWFSSPVGDRVWPRTAEFLRALDDQHCDGWLCPQALDIVRQQGRHELGTHGFEHLAILDQQLTHADFEHDLRLVQTVGRLKGFTSRTLIYPRNQVGFLTSLNAAGIDGYRDYIGSQRLPFPAPEKLHSKWDALAALGREFKLWQRPQTIGALDSVSSSDPIAIPPGYFLNWRVGLRRRVPIGLSLRRWELLLEKAARDGGLAHVWSHPHNFITGDREFDLFEGIVRAAAKFVQRGQIENLTQAEFCDRLRPVRRELSDAA